MNFFQKLKSCRHDVILNEFCLLNNFFNITFLLLTFSFKFAFGLAIGRDQRS